jgi:hypothetical protein
MTSNIENVLSLVSLVCGLGGAIFGALMWYRGAIEKGYAAQRDFGHLRRNQEQFAQNLLSIDNDLRALKEELKEQFHQQNSELMELRLVNLTALTKMGVHVKLPSEVAE